MSPTPILDRQQPLPPEPPVKVGRSRAIGAVIGLALVFLPATLMEHPTGFEPALGCLGFMGGLFLGVLVHELGHVAAGLAVGFEFRRILAGPLMLTREAGGYRFRFLRKRIIAGGYTFMAPRSPDNLRRPFAIFALGGPLATALCFLPLIFVGWGTLTVAMAAANLLLACTSWIPFTIRGHYTDAKIIQVLARRGPEADRLAAVLYIMALDQRGTHPREWPPHVLADLAKPGGDPAYRASGRIYLYCYAEETAPPDAVAAALEQMLALAPEMRGDLRRAYFAQAAYWQAVTHRNVALAHAWLADARAVKNVLDQKDWDAASLAAIALAEGNQPQFRECFTRALAYLDRQPGPSGLVAASRTRLLALETSF